MVMEMEDILEFLLELTWDILMVITEPLRSKVKKWRSRKKSRVSRADRNTGATLKMRTNKMTEEKLTVSAKISILVAAVAGIIFMVCICRAASLPAGSKDYEQREKEALISFGVAAAAGTIMVVCITRSHPQGRIEQYRLLYSDRKQIQFALRKRALQLGYDTAADDSGTLLCRGKGQRCVILYFCKQLDYDWEQVRERCRKLSGVSGGAVSFCVAAEELSPGLYNMMEASTEPPERHNYCAAAILSEQRLYLPANQKRKKTEMKNIWLHAIRT